MASSLSFLLQLSCLGSLLLVLLFGRGHSGPTVSFVVLLLAIRAGSRACRLLSFRLPPVVVSQVSWHSPLVVLFVLLLLLLRLRRVIINQHRLRSDSLRRM